jgi:uncharacterized radical SAM protein YgiQ
VSDPQAHLRSLALPDLPLIEAPGEPPRRASSPDLLELAKRAARPQAPDRVRHLPTTRAEMEARGWDAVDVVFVSGDAYVDHPSFAMALLGRVLEAAGWRVGMLCQPEWKRVDDFMRFGAPRVLWAVSAGNMDSMLNHYTAARKVRNADAYSPGGRIGLRPDRATNAYVQRCREANKQLGATAPIVAGGVEASLRRLAHYDHWSQTVRPSILASSKADLVVHGMGEAPLLAIVRRLAAGEPVAALRDMRATAWLLGGKEEVPAGDGVVELPDFEAVRDSRRAFSEASRMALAETNAGNGRVIVQRHGGRAVVINPPWMPLTEVEMDAIYDLPFARRPHPTYREQVPAFETTRHSLVAMRGCFGGCSFCSITMHQGRPISSRSEESLLRELEAMKKAPGWKGIVSDLGGPTANMYRMRCTRPEVEERCRRPSCVHPKVCKLLGASHQPIVELMRRTRKTDGVRKVHVASGIRMDLAERSPRYLEELARHHVGGHLKVAPEHACDEVLGVMRKPGIASFDRFAKAFEKASKKAGKEQYLVPYFISSHPGASLEHAVELALYLKKRGYRPLQVQDFIPAPMDEAAAAYHTGLDPRTGRPIPVARGERDRRMQRALLQWWKPENWTDVRDALRKVGRTDLIGPDDRHLIAERPPAGSKSGPQRPRRGKKGYRPKEW